MQTIMQIPRHAKWLTICYDRRGRYDNEIVANIFNFNIYYFFIYSVIPLSQCVRNLLLIFFFCIPSLWFFFYNKFHPSHTSISLHRNLNISRIILHLGCCISMAHARSDADCASGDLLRSTRRMRDRQWDRCEYDLLLVSRLTRV